jgi:uncharacterized protein
MLKAPMFEFDPVKSKLNKEKHGIDFVEVQALWRDERRIGQAARSDVEERHLIVGRIGDSMWCAVYTVRITAIRLISVRKARKEEVEAYERYKDDWS